MFIYIPLAVTRSILNGFFFENSATIDVSIDISWLNVIIAFKFLEHVQHIIDHTSAKFEYDLLRKLLKSKV